VLAWRRLRPAVSRYLAATGFRFSYRADGVSVYRPAWRSVAPATARRTPTQPGRHRRQ
jgi:hypothetical protein